jgi:hypothetical protein
MIMYCKVDGIDIDNRVQTSRIMRQGGGWTFKFNEYRTAETTIQKLQFAKPVSIMLFEMWITDCC